jgi:anionic cell wall polymer biosynthesis LytR-Cps2A-Psr (LCP) family protein
MVMKKFFKILFILSIVLNLVLIALIVFLWIQASYLMKHRESSDLEFKKNLYDALKTDNAEKLEEFKSNLLCDIKSKLEISQEKSYQDIRLGNVIGILTNYSKNKKTQKDSFFRDALYALSNEIRKGAKIPRSLIDKYLGPPERKVVPKTKGEYIYSYCSFKSGKKMFLTLFFDADDNLKCVLFKKHNQDSYKK